MPDTPDELMEFMSLAISDQPRARAMIAKNRALLDDVRTGLEETALHYLVVENYVEAVGFLLREGAAVDCRSFDGATPLLDAAGLGYVEMVKLLLASGADVHAVDSHGDNALHRAARDDAFDIIRALVDAGIDVNARDSLRESALHLLLENNGSSRSIDLLRSADAQDLAWEDEVEDPDHAD